MNGDMSLGDILKLNISERIQFVEDIWDSIVSVPEAVSLTDSQKEELDKRLKAYHNDPSLGSPWSEVKKRILNQ